jgi:hypothetical protein
MRLAVNVWFELTAMAELGTLICMEPGPCWAHADPIIAKRTSEKQSVARPVRMFALSKLLCCSYEDFEYCGHPELLGEDSNSKGEAAKSLRVI